MDLCLLIGMIGMIQNTLRNKDKHSLISKRNKKILKLPTDLRKRRRSLKRRRRVESLEEMSLMLIMMIPTQLISTLALKLLRNLTWMKKLIVIDTKKKKRSRKIWAIQELNKIEANLMPQVWINTINLIIWMTRSLEIFTINKIEDLVYQDYSNMIVHKDLSW